MKRRNCWLGYNNRDFSRPATLKAEIRVRADERSNTFLLSLSFFFVRLYLYQQYRYYLDRERDRWWRRFRPVVDRWLRHPLRWMSRWSKCTSGRGHCRRTRAASAADSCAQPSSLPWWRHTQRRTLGSTPRIISPGRRAACPTTHTHTDAERKKEKKNTTRSDSYKSH